MRDSILPIISSIIVPPSLAHTIVREQRFDKAPNYRFDAFARTVRIYLTNAIGLSGSDGLITFRNPLEESAVSFLDPVAHERKSSLSRKKALGAGMTRNDHQDGEVRARVSDGSVYHALDHFQIQTATVALVSSSGIVEAIT